jgi:membrane-bound lytic murein transglycosylase B
MKGTDIEGRESRPARMASLGSSDMTKGGQFKTATVAALVAFVWMTSKAGAAQCGSTAAGFEAWKKQFADEARGRGVSASTVAALMCISRNSI